MADEQKQNKLSSEPENKETEPAGETGMEGRDFEGRGEEDSTSVADPTNTKYVVNTPEEDINIPRYLHENNFFYDEEMQNRLITVTLHPNKVYVTDENAEAWMDPNSKFTDDDGYLKTPIITAISTDDFNVSIANDWSDANFGSEIQSMVNSGVPMAPYLAYFSKMAKWGEEKGEQQIAKMLKEGTYSYQTYQIATKINGALGSLGGFLGDAAKSMNRILVLQGTRFSYYAGTGVSFGNLILKFTIFANWMENPDGFVSFVTVEEQLRHIYDYAIGKYMNWSDFAEVADESGNTKASPTIVKSQAERERDAKNRQRESPMDKVIRESRTKEVEGWKFDELAESFLSEFAGWQLPPGGYEPKIKDVDTIAKGTFRLKIGTIYQLDNLVIQDVQLNFSKHMVKKPTLDVDNFEYHPLYCDVQITLKPASKYSDMSLKRFVNRTNGGETKEEYKSVNDAIKNSLKKVNTKNV